MFCESPAHTIDERVTLILCADERVATICERDAVLYRISEQLEYVAFASDFGPFNLASTFSFCRSLQGLVETHPGSEVAVVSMSDSKSLANAIFLLGSYLIVVKDAGLAILERVFRNLLPEAAGYCDVSRHSSGFQLEVRDCWEGLIQARSLRWLRFPSQSEEEGCFDVESYTHLDDPLNADMHVIVPDKIIAMKGPKDLGGSDFVDSYLPDGRFLSRDFSPSHYADILTQFDVQAVVRLNEPSSYDADEFRSHGIAVADLFFDDCTPPSALVVAKFLAVAESVEGAVAVHCKAGLGRTGTLIALYMMKHHGFSARAAMGWLRIVRPGSVIGSQQGFLVEREAAIARNRHHCVECRVRVGACVGEVQGALDRTCATLDACCCHFHPAVCRPSVPFAHPKCTSDQARAPLSIAPPASFHGFDELGRAPSLSEGRDVATRAGARATSVPAGRGDGGKALSPPSAAAIAAYVEQAAARRCAARARLLQP